MPIRLNVKAAVVIETVTRIGTSGIATAGNAIPTPNESRLIDNDVMSRPLLVASI
jgi:hypothetical protein